MFCSMDKLISYIRSRMKFDPKEVENYFKTEISMLHIEEKVELAFRNSRYMYLITTEQVLAIDCYDFLYKKIRFLSIPIKFIYGFTVQFPHSLSRRVRIVLFSSNAGEYLTIELRENDSNISQIWIHVPESGRQFN